MISLVRGTLIAKSLDRVEVLTATGVAYECLVPASTFERLPSVGREATLHTALVSREDGLEMYGFAEALERRLFVRLQVAAGVGPKLALAMVGAIPPERLVRAIREKDIPRLQTIPGVGKKKAERIVLELHERLDDLAAEMPAAPAYEPESEQAVAALVALGYPRGEAEQSVQRAVERANGKRLETADLVRAALTELA